MTEYVCSLCGRPLVNNFYTVNGWEHTSIDSYMLCRRFWIDEKEGRTLMEYFRSYHGIEMLRFIIPVEYILQEKRSIVVYKE
jgi:DNA-directed RNA polymerase subunit RPC12/RpoP